MPYMLLSGVVGLIVVAIAGIRLLTKSRPPASGDYVTQNVLTRIRTDYHDLP